MPALRTKTVLKTDLQEFSARVEGMTSVELDAFLHAHRSLLVGIVRDGGGNVVKELGDSVLAVFDSSTSALLCAIEMQRQAAAGCMGKRVGLRVMLSAGDVLLRDDDAFGPAVNLVSRLETVTPPGEIYFTESVHLLCNRAEVASEPVDAYALKGISDPVHVHRTTYRHQTRELHDAAVLLTDLAGFTRFALSAPLAAVEDLLQAWTAAHELAAAQHQGVAREQHGDSFVLTLPTAVAAVRCWLTLSESGDRIFGALPPGVALDFGAGLSVGTVRVFKSALYGVAVNEASRCQDLSRDAPGRHLIATASAIGTVPAEELSGIEVRSFVPTTPAAAPDRPLDRLKMPALVSLCRAAAALS